MLPGKFALDRWNNIPVAPAEILQAMFLTGLFKEGGVKSAAKSPENVTDLPPKFKLCKLIYS